MGRRLLPALCGGGRVATRVRRKQRVQRPNRHRKHLPAASVTGGSKSPEGGGGCYVNGNGALMIEVGKKKKYGGGRRVMVVADGRKEAAGALQWALSQAVRSNDTIVLLSVVKPVVPQEAVSDSCVKILGPKCSKHIEALKSICESTRPEVKVETCVVEADERAPAVVEAARRHGASLLVLGQRRRLRVPRWLQTLWWWRRGRTGTVEYCIEHAPCAALGVRRRSSGGYLVSSKRHKDFWLLA
ncbi:hypothetical protein PR202_ga12661 [Eleusine coracana subsp. coracana]|uniref:UspA domain-containing protein n=1 Tax=Eleusine coracana subsp. coracana TaxID=191504 RepID=A0AAV5CCM5_ELECO|nr:hypothetical protein PR202_ga12661 [Eleusine coracana subsp. coracana]